MSETGHDEVFSGRVPHSRAIMRVIGRSNFIIIQALGYLQETYSESTAGMMPEIVSMCLGSSSRDTPHTIMWPSLPHVVCVTNIIK